MWIMSSILMILQCSNWLVLQLCPPNEDWVIFDSLFQLLCHQWVVKAHLRYMDYASTIENLNSYTYFFLTQFKFEKGFFCFSWIIIIIIIIFMVWRINPPSQLHMFEWPRSLCAPNRKECKLRSYELLQTHAKVKSRLPKLIWIRLADEIWEKLLRLGR